MKTVFDRKICVVAWVALAVAGARADTITYQSASSQVDANGVTQVRNDSSATDGLASTVAIWPPGTMVPQGRTAARSGALEIAANARVFSDTFTGRDFDLTLSQAYYAVHLDPVLFSTNMSLDFFLPPSFLELVSNAETFFLELDTLLFADLRVCQQPPCSLADRQFYFQAGAIGTHLNMQHTVIAEGNPSLDLTSLLNPTVTDTGGFVRTYLVEFPQFFGHLDLGTYNAGTPITVEYTLQARASGTVAFSSAIAAVNDPFELDGDPVRQGAPLIVTVTPVGDQVPEPAAGVMVLSGLALLWISRRPRRN